MQICADIYGTLRNMGFDAWMVGWLGLDFMVKYIQ